jgi:pimeloyl-ACP methyl ester carboxylesterase
VRVTLPPLPQLDGVEHRYETVNGVRIHYAEAGAGEPLLLVHGWPQHWWMWRNQIGPLAERFRVIVPDMRGHGWSGKPRSSYSKTELLGDLLGLLDRLGIDRVRWVGHDWGAVAGLMGALGEPQRFERFVSIAIPHPWQLRSRDPRLAAISSYQLVLGGPAGGFAMRHGVVRAMLRGGRSIGRYTPEEVAMYESVCLEPDATRASVQLYRTWMLREVRDWASGKMRARRLTVPTLWLIGENDVLARSADDNYLRHAGDMTLVRVPGANHFMPEELPEGVTERLLAFL